MRKAYLLEGHPAEDMAKLCFSKLRFYPVSLKDRLHREGLWEDLTQELYRIALDGWRRGMTARQTGGMASNELRAFFKSCGYHRYQCGRGGRDGEGFAKPEMPLPDGWERSQSMARLLFGDMGEDGDEDGDSIETAILDLLDKYPEGLSQVKVCCLLRKRVGSAPLINNYCERLVTRGVLTEVARPKGKGRPPSPMLFRA